MPIKNTEIRELRIMSFSKKISPVIRIGTSGRGPLWIIAGLLIAFGISLFVFFGGEEGGGGHQMRERPATPVVVRAVSLYLFADVIEAIGTARANESVTLTAQVSDTVKEVHFSEGGTVAKGDVLVTLNNAEELANVSAALASYTQAKQQFDRTKPLVDKGTLSQATLDGATRDLDEATARLTAIRARAGDYIITAPFSGILGLRQISPGTLVSPGTPVTTLDDITLIKLDFSVPERYLVTITPGQEIVSQAAAYAGEEFRGVVKTIDSRVNPVTRSIIVRAEVPNPDGKLKPGMLLTADLVSNLTTSLSVPEKAVITVGEENFIFRLGAEDIVSRVKITVGRRYGDQVEILDGLSEGDKIVTSGILRLGPDMVVKVLREEDAPPWPDFLMEFMPKGEED